MQRLRSATHAALRAAGLELKRISLTPGAKLFGLRGIPIRTVIDVGANEGQFAKHILGFFPSARIYSFEPVPDAYARLVAWSSARSGQIVPLGVALGDAEGEVEMFQHTTHTPSSSLLRTNGTHEAIWPLTAEQKSIRVRLTTLDEALRGREIIPDLLIKLDVQGYEDRVIRGGTEMFRKARACILEVCLDGLYDGQASFKDLLISLDALGLDYAGAIDQVCAADGHVIYFDALFLRRARRA